MLGRASGVLTAAFPNNGDPNTVAPVAAALRRKSLRVFIATILRFAAVRLNRSSMTKPAANADVPNDCSFQY